MKKQHYILTSVIDDFISAPRSNTSAFEKLYPGLDWEKGFVEAILTYADNNIRREIMITYLIDAIREIEEKV